MHSHNPTPTPALHDVFWIDGETGQATADDKSEFSINDLGNEFALTHRALRFYESRGLLKPRREGRRRIFSCADRDRLALIVKGKKLGFTLTEISQMIEAEAGRASAHGLKLTAEKCLAQIAQFERQIAEAKEALAELHRIHKRFSA